MLLKRLKLWARITEALVLLAGLAVLFCVLALADIFNGDTYPEWTIIRVSFLVIVLCLVSTFITLYFLFRFIERRDEEKSDLIGAVLKRVEGAESKGPEPHQPPAARRMRTRTLPGKTPSSKTARRQRKRTR
jgi:uncharacterized membrane protein YcjF (UPF0283 family)